MSIAGNDGGSNCGIDESIGGSVVSIGGREVSVVGTDESALGCDEFVSCAVASAEGSMEGPLVSGTGGLAGWESGSLGSPGGLVGWVGSAISQVKTQPLLKSGGTEVALAQ